MQGRNGWWRIGFRAAAALILMSALAGGQGTKPPKPQAASPSPRVFADSRFSMDQILERPYGPDVPMGCTGDRLWATSPQGWAFGDDVHWVYLTGLHALDLEIRDSQGLLLPEKATYHPSHVHMAGAKRAVLGSASFTFRLDNPQNPLIQPFNPEKRWTCWSSGNREDWYAVDFGAPRSIASLRLFFFDDTGQGACRPPESLRVQQWTGEKWTDVEIKEQTPKEPEKGENLLKFAAPIQTARVRLVFQHAGEAFYTGLYGFQALNEKGQESAASPALLQVTADKFITPDDILVSVVRVKNPTDKPQVVQVVPVPGWEGQQEFQILSNRAQGKKEPSGSWSVSADWQTRLHNFDVRQSFRFVAMTDPPEELDVNEKLKVILADSHGPADNADWMRKSMPFSYTIEPGTSRLFKAALEIKKIDEPSTVSRVVDAPTIFARARTRDSDRLGTLAISKQDARDPLKDQMKSYQDWFDGNLAYFDCSDEFVRKMYYHRAYNLRKNMMDPKLGALKWPTQSEGRWRSPWYANVISYGAAHQIREARWLRDPKYWRGHLQTWAENQKPDHVYPSHVTPAGPSGGQYADWISSTAWDGHLVHPSKDWLASVVDKLAQNTRGWQTVYDPDDDGLLLVDSHWWTGMEYQPSFFYFSDYKTAPNFYEPAEKVSLERVDLTAYNFGNATNVARIYRLLGQDDKAQEFESLAEKIRTAVTSQMWQADGSFFYSLKADDNTVADVKEVIGVYPFYFGLPARRRGLRGRLGQHPRPRAILDPLAGRLGLEAVPRLLPGQLASERPGLRLHVERPHLAPCELHRPHRHGPHAPVRPRPQEQGEGLHPHQPEALGTVPLVHEGPVPRPGSHLPLDRRVLQRLRRPLEDQRTRLQPLHLDRRPHPRHSRPRPPSRRDPGSRPTDPPRGALRVPPRRPGLSRPQRHSRLGPARRRRGPLRRRPGRLRGVRRRPALCLFEDAGTPRNRPENRQAGRLGRPETRRRPCPDPEALGKSLTNVRRGERGP